MAKNICVDSLLLSLVFSDMQRKVKITVLHPILGMRIADSTGSLDFGTNMSLKSGFQQLARERDHVEDLNHVQVPG